MRRSRAVSVLFGSSSHQGGRGGGGELASQHLSPYVEAYTPPPWVSAPISPSSSSSCFSSIPSHRVVLGNFPTPISRLRLPAALLPDGVELYLKREDFSGLELSGNKIRKLEFLLYEALQQGADCVVTCGGTQSNHCRATAAAARTLGLGSFLLLRDKAPDRLMTEEYPGLDGNLIYNRLVGAQLVLLSREEYAAYGSEAMLQDYAEGLRKQGRRPYVIPVGGSNALGTWGYLDMVEELRQQLEAAPVLMVSEECPSPCSHQQTLWNQRSKMLQS